MTQHLVDFRQKYPLFQGNGSTQDKMHLMYMDIEANYLHIMSNCCMSTYLQYVQCQNRHKITNNAAFVLQSK